MHVRMHMPDSTRHAHAQVRRVLGLNEESPAVDEPAPHGDLLSTFELVFETLDEDRNGSLSMEEFTRVFLEVQIEMAGGEDSIKSTACRESAPAADGSLRI